jgi:hypothetical protein
VVLQAYNTCFCQPRVRKRKATKARLRHTVSHGHNVIRIQAYIYLSGLKSTHHCRLTERTPHGGNQLSLIEHVASSRSIVRASSPTALYSVLLFPNIDTIRPDCAAFYSICCTPGGIDVGSATWDAFIAHRLTRSVSTRGFLSGNCGRPRTRRWRHYIHSMYGNTAFASLEIRCTDGMGFYPTMQSGPRSSVSG